jgi:hypothetical protein
VAANQSRVNTASPLSPLALSNPVKLSGSKLSVSRPNTPNSDRAAASEQSKRKGVAFFDLLLSECAPGPPFKFINQGEDLIVHFELTSPDHECVKAGKFTATSRSFQASFVFKSLADRCEGYQPGPVDCLIELATAVIATDKVEYEVSRTGISFVLHLLQANAIVKELKISSGPSSVVLAKDKSRKSVQDLQTKAANKGHTGAAGKPLITLSETKSADPVSNSCCCATF